MARRDFPDGADDPAYRELYLRWFQYSVFCPLMRSHGTPTREIWNFGQPGDLVYGRIKYCRVAPETHAIQLQPGGAGLF